MVTNKGGKMKFIPLHASSSQQMSDCKCLAHVKWGPGQVWLTLHSFAAWHAPNLPWAIKSIRGGAFFARLRAMRAFLVVAPWLWNCLLREVGTAHSLYTFWKLYNWTLFRCALEMACLFVQTSFGGWRIPMPGPMVGAPAGVHSPMLGHGSQR